MNKRKFFMRITNKYFLGLCWVILFLIPNTGDTYFQLNDKAKKNYLLLNRYSDSFGKNNKTFVIFDNLDNFSLNQSHGRILYPLADNFVPADQIDCNFALPISYKHTVTVDDLVAKLLYANLKIKKIVAEYEDVQKRYRELMKDLNIPFLDSKLSIDKNIDNKPSIYNDIKSLIQDYSNINDQSLPSLSSGISTYQKNRSLTPLFRENRKARLNPAFPSHSSTSEKKSRTPVSNDSTELPWVFMFLTGIIQYLISHKFESALIGFFLYLVILVISSIHK